MKNVKIVKKQWKTGMRYLLEDVNSDAIEFKSSRLDITVGFARLNDLEIINLKEFLEQEKEARA